MIEDNSGTSIAVVFAIIIVLGFGIGGGLWFFFYKDGTDPISFAKKNALKQPTKLQDIPVNTPGLRKKEDINDDGVVTAEDVQIVQQNVGCNSTNDCWDKMIGKTKSGDNPYFSYDLDMDGDSAITQTDVEDVQNAITAP